MLKMIRRHVLSWLHSRDGPCYMLEDRFGSDERMGLIVEIGWRGWWVVIMRHRWGPEMGTMIREIPMVIFWGSRERREHRERIGLADDVWVL